MRHLLSAIFLSLWPLSAAAQVETSLELVLLADASGSIDAMELAFQRQGYADAIQSPQVLAAIQDTAYGHIAITYVEWAVNQDVVVDWMLIDGPASAAVFADRIAQAPRRAVGRNAIGSALIRGQQMIDENDYDGFRHVIDFSGDSIGNSNGPPISIGRDAALSSGTTINALPILRPEDGRRAGSNLEEEYANRIIGGPGAFMVTAAGRDSFADAVQRKLFLEIAGRVPVNAVASAD